MSTMTHEQAEQAGREWAESEWDARVDESPAPGPWRATDRDALPLVDGETDEERAELAELANDAARDHWADLVKSDAQ